MLKIISIKDSRLPQTSFKYWLYTQSKIKNVLPFLSVMRFLEQFLLYAIHFHSS